MKILIDTNIILDILLSREPFIDNANKLITIIDRDNIQAFLTANSITDIVYIARKVYGYKDTRKMVLELIEIIDIIDVSKNDIINAFNLEINDFEDALQCSCSEKEHIDLIITRNINDFKNSNVNAIDIINFISSYENK